MGAEGTVYIPRCCYLLYMEFVAEKRGSWVRPGRDIYTYKGTDRGTPLFTQNNLDMPFNIIV